MTHHTMSPAGVAAQLAKYEAMSIAELEAEKHLQQAILQPPSAEEVANMRNVNPAVRREVASAKIRLIDQVLASR